MIFVALFLLSLILTALTVPLTIGLAERIGAVDLPTSRKIHVTPVPRLGGLAIIFSVAASLFAGTLFNSELKALLSGELCGMIFGILIILVLGVWDDIRNVNPWIKFAFQVLAASVAVSLGIEFDLTTNPLVSRMDYFNLGILSFPMTVLWIVFLTNSMNLIDGLDGLATGITLFTSLTLFLISLDGAVITVSFFYITIAGAALGFLRYNRYPAQVFLGDTGSMSLGFALACLSVAAFQKSFTLASFLIPVIIFGIPIFDSILALTRRYVGNKGLVTADREHLHHQLMELGLTQRQTVLVLYFVTILLGIIAFAFTVQLDSYAAIIVIVIGVVGGMVAKELRLFAVRPREMDREFVSRKLPAENVETRAAVMHPEDRPDI